MFSTMSCTLDVSLLNQQSLAILELEEPPRGPFCCCLGSARNPIVIWGLIILGVDVPNHYVRLRCPSLHLG